MNKYLVKITAETNMYRLIIALSFGLHTLSYGQNFTGQVYQLANSYVETKCAVDPECDCCSSDLIFLTENKFALIARCLYNDAYYTGSYQVKNDELRLTFKQTVVHEIVNETTNEVKNEIKNIKTPLVRFNISICGKSTVRLEYASKDGEDFQNGSRHDKTKEEEMRKELESTAAWKLLNE